MSKKEIIECRNTNSLLCKICSGDYCNKKSTLDKCLTCQSESDPNCISNTTLVPLKICASYDNKCYTIVNDDKTVQRGCCDVTERNFMHKCEYDNSQCEICLNHVENACNNKKLSDTCIMCDSNTNPMCRTNPEKINEIACSVKPLMDTHGCYFNNSNNTVTRGCFDDLNILKQFKCRREFDQCKRCMGRNCNAKVIVHQKCYVCNGTKDTSCTGANITDTISCPTYASSCFTGIDANGFTHRGCMEPKIASVDAKTFEFQQGLEICYDDLCNNKIIPKNRFKCFQCEGRDDCQHVEEKSKICKIFSTNDECYAYTSQGTVVSFCNMNTIFS